MKMTIDKEIECEQDICPYAILKTITATDKYMVAIDENYKRLSGIDNEAISLVQSAFNLVSFVENQGYSAGY